MAGGSFDFLRCCCVGYSPIRGCFLLAPSRKSKPLISRGRRIRGRVLGEDFDKVWMRAAAAQVSSAELRAGLAARGSWGGVFAGDSPLSPALCAPPAGAVRSLGGLITLNGIEVLSR